MVTSFTLSTFGAPAITRAYLQWPLSAADEVVPAWLATSRRGPTGGCGRRSSCSAARSTRRARRSSLSATWTGPASRARPALRPLLSQVPAATVDNRTTEGYLDTMLAFAGCALDPGRPVHDRRRGARCPGSASRRPVHVVDREQVDVDALLDRVQAAQGSGLTEAGISLDSLGGAVDDLGPADTAFGHRGALATVQYTATYASGPAGPALHYVRAFRKAMTPSWGTGAYVNYADAAIADYQQAYFGDNAARLAEVRAAYDPDGFFTQPQDF